MERTSYRARPGAECRPGAEEGSCSTLHAHLPGHRSARDGEKRGEIQLPLWWALPFPYSSVSALAAWLGAGALGAPKSGSQGSFFGRAETGTHPAKAERRGKGSRRPLLRRGAEAPGVPGGRCAPVPRSPTAAASRHDTAAATKRRPPPASVLPRPSGRCSGSEFPSG